MKRARVSEDFNPVYPYGTESSPNVPFITPPFASSNGLQESPPGVLALKYQEPITTSNNGELTLKLGSGLTLNNGALSAASPPVTAPLTTSANGTIGLASSPPLTVSAGSLTLAHNSPLTVSSNSLSLTYSQPLTVSSDSLTLSKSAPLTTTAQGELGLTFTTPLHLASEALALSYSAPLSLNSDSLGLSYSSPLKLNSDALSLNVSDPLQTSGEALTLNTEAPLTVANSALSLTTQAPLAVTDGALALNMQSPITTSDNSLALSLGNGLGVTNSQLAVKATGGINFDSSGNIRINAAGGMRVNNSNALILHVAYPFEATNQLTLRTGSGLILNSSNQLQVSIDTSKGLFYQSTGNSISCKLGTGLKFDSNGGIALSSATTRSLSQPQSALSLWSHPVRPNCTVFESLDCCLALCLTKCGAHVLGTVSLTPVTGPLLTSMPTDSLTVQLLFDQNGALLSGSLDPTSWGYKDDNALAPGSVNDAMEFMPSTLLYPRGRTDNLSSQFLPASQPLAFSVNYNIAEEGFSLSFSWSAYTGQKFQAPSATFCYVSEQ
ncbi:fiber-1 [Simian adenovirus 16]|uniref:Fiber-1 n=1 Tax=Simian adenovirus 16 TaxID=1715778 RepID=A0A0M5L3Z3_9ADEN|nr:fiber-1 [Simian adenovirus 16]ALE30411.1 fiber-1 [Simian adenovirus 16]